MLIAMVASAQTAPLQFCTQDGEIIKSGSEPVVVTEFDSELAEFGMFEMHSGIFVKNTTSSDVTASISVDVLEIQGQMSICLGTNCVPFSKVGTGEVKNVALKANSMNDLQCHWSPESKDGKPQYGRCDAMLTLYANGEQCSSIQVTFMYSDKSNPVNAPSATTASSRIYNMAGQQVSNMNAHGIFIKNGKKIVK